MAPEKDPFRIGLGEDTHRLATGGPLRLGGIDIPHDQHAVGHSDADVLLHAITDALLGAVSLPDIGQLFPNTEEENRDRDSAEMLQLAYEKVKETGFRIVNLDCAVFLEAPKLSPHKRAVIKQIAEVLSIEINQINVKAKTGEGIGPVGEKKLIQARAIALLTQD